MDQDISFLRELREYLSERRRVLTEGYNTASDFNAVCKIKGGVRELDLFVAKIKEIVEKRSNPTPTDE